MMKSSKMNQEEIRLLEAVAPVNSDSTANCMKQENFDTDEGRQSVPTQQGLLFYVGSKLKDLTVTGIEVGIRSVANLDGNLQIQVFSSNQTYDESNIDPAAFEKIADVQMIQNPDDPDTALIPAYALKSLVLPRLTRTTLLFRAARPILDYRLDASTKPKDQAVSGNRMVVFAGNPIPLDTPADVPIPTQLDMSLNSIFLGNFFLELERDNCGADPKPNIVSTAVKFVHVVNATLAGPDYRNIEDQVNTEVDNLFLNDNTLAQYVGDYNLKMPDSSKSFFEKFQGKCVDDTWDACNYVVTELTLKHYDTISPGMVKKAFIGNAKSFASRIESQLLSNGNVAFYYLGYELVQGNFKLTLDGVPPNQQMDDDQTGFFKDQVMAFLNAQFPEIYAEVYDIEVAGQKASRRRLAQGDTGSIELTGTISGGQLAVLQNADFAARVDSAFESASATFESAIKYNAYLPGPMAQDERYKYFQGLKSTKSLTTPNNNGIVEFDSGCSTCADKPTSNGSGGGVSSSSDSSDSSGGLSMTMIIGVGAGVLALALILCACTVRYCFCRKQTNKKASKTSADDQYKKVKTIPDKIYLDDYANRTQATAADLSTDFSMQGSLTPPPRTTSVRGSCAPVRGSHSRSGSAPGMGNQQVPSRSGQKPSYKSGQRPAPPSPRQQANRGATYGSGGQPVPPSVGKPHRGSDDRQAPGSDYGSGIRPSAGQPRPGAAYNQAPPVPPSPGQSNRHVDARGPTVAPSQEQQQPRRASVDGPGSEHESRQVPGVCPSRESVAPKPQAMQQPRLASTVQSAKPGAAVPRSAPAEAVVHSPESPPHPPKPVHNHWAQPPNPPVATPMSRKGSFGAAFATNHAQQTPVAATGWSRDGHHPVETPMSRKGSLGAAFATNHVQQTPVAATGWSRDGHHPVETPISRKGSLGAAFATNHAQQTPIQQTPIESHLASPVNPSRRGSLFASLGWTRGNKGEEELANEGLPFIPATPQTPLHPRQGRNSSPQRSMIAPMTPMSASHNHLFSPGMRNYDDMSSQRSFSYNGEMLSPERRGSNMSIAHRRGSNLSVADRRGSNLSASERRGSNLSVPPSPLHAPTSRRVSGSYSNNLFVPESPLHAPTSRREPASYSTRTTSWSPVRISRKQTTSPASPGRRSVSTGRGQSTSFPDAPMGPQGIAEGKNSMTMAITNSSGNPAFTRQALERMSVRDLKQLLPHDDKFQPVDKKDLVDHLIKVGAVDLISCYKMSTLQQMSGAQLRKCLKESGVQFDPRFVVEKRDMIRVFQASGKLQVIPEDDY